MPRRAAGSKSTISRKEQNRINQQAFRERKRQEFDGMREALACMKATNPEAGSKVHLSKNDVDISNPIMDPCNESANLLSDETLCPADLRIVEVLPKSNMIGGGCDVINLSTSEKGSCFSNVQNFGGDDFKPSYAPAFDYTQAVVSGSGAELTDLSYSNGSYSGEDWYPKQHQDITQAQEILSHCDVPLLINGSPGQITDIAADYNNAQTLALKSAEWYAKAAEVGLLKIATLHHRPHTCMPTWQQPLPTYTVPTNYLDNVEEVHSGPITSLSYDAKLPSQPLGPFDFNYYEPWSQESTQAW